MACACLCQTLSLSGAPPGTTYNFTFFECNTGLPTTIFVNNDTQPVIHYCMPSGNLTQNFVLLTGSFVNLVFNENSSGFRLINCTNDTDFFYTTTDLTTYLAASAVLEITGHPGCWRVATADICDSSALITVTDVFASCVKCLEGVSCYLLTNCNPLAVPATIITSTDLFLNLGSVVTLTGYTGCWLVSESATCEGSVLVSVIQSYTNCETCSQEYVTFVSCCGGFELHFVKNLFTIPTYLVNNTVYVYNGSLYTDGFNTMYPGQCYTYKNTFSSALLPTFAVPPFASFTSTGVTTGNCANVVSLCDHCFYKLTNCDIENDVIYTYTDLSASIGDIITISGYPDICWIVSESDTAILPVVVTPVGISYATCLDCKGYFFTINDCCTDEPYLVNGVPLVLEYHGLSNPGFSPADLSTQIITTINLANGDSITGCFYIVDITTASRSSVAQSQIVIDWDTDLEFVTVPTCEDCQSCKTCYLLTNCVTGEVEYITGTDLLQYIGGVITIAGCKDQCWIVTQAENCDGCGGAITVLSYFPSTDPAVGQICTYTFNTKPSTITSGTIVIDGVTYPLAITSFADLITSINALGLGTAYVGNGGTIPLIGIVGNHVYGLICLTGNNGEAPITNCFTPVCTNYLNNCTYSVLTVDGTTIPDRTVTITINGIVHTTVLTADTVNKLLIWLNSLGLGFFTATVVGTNCTIQVFGNATYGNIVIGSIPISLVTLTPTCITPSVPPCDLCLPQPIPELPVVLNTRFVKPGYSTPSCSPEYTERVNCNYGDQLYNRMLSVRYGLTVCCDEAFDKWLIKKELLDLDSLKNTEFDCCPPIAPCSVCNTQECCCVVIPVIPVAPCVCYIAEIACESRLDCVLTSTSCTGTPEYLYVTGGSTEIIYLCSSTVPEFSGTSLITPLSLSCAAGDCVPPPPCVSTCYEIFVNDAGTSLTYFDCTTEQTVVQTLIAGTYYICSGTLPQATGSATITVLLNNCALGECVAPPCVSTCYEVIVSYSDTIRTISYLDCETGNIITMDTQGGIYYLCSVTIPTISSGTFIAVNILALNCATGECVLPCNCYSVTRPSCSNPLGCGVRWADCNGDLVTTIVPNGSSFSEYVCSPIAPYGTAVTSTLLTLDCATGECITPPPCFCWSFTLSKPPEPLQFTFNTCNGTPVTIDGVYSDLTMCSPIAPTFTGGIAIGTNVGPCFVDCGILTPPTCQCYIIEVTSSDASTANVDFNVDPCDVAPTQINVTSLDGPVYGCYSFCPSVVTSTPNAIVTITIRSELNCGLGECALPV